VFFEHARSRQPASRRLAVDRFRVRWKIQIPLLTGKKNLILPFFAKIPSRKHALIQVFAGWIRYADSRTAAE
jgi:hypothetical protein